LARADAQEARCGNTDPRDEADSRQGSQDRSSTQWVAQFEFFSRSRAAGELGRCIHGIGWPMDILEVLSHRPEAGRPA
jgi:hypothetical protein